MKENVGIQLPYSSEGDTKNSTPAELFSQQKYLQNSLKNEAVVGIASTASALLSGVLMIGLDQSVLSVAAGVVTLLSAFIADTAGIYALCDRNQLRIVNSAVGKTDSVKSRNYLRKILIKN